MSAPIVEHGIEISGTAAHREEITNAGIGQHYYATDDDTYSVWTGSAWEPVTADGEITGTATVDAIAGGDSILQVTGLAGSGGSAGGTVVVAGGAGNGTGAGGATSMTGGASGAGATGNGGAASVVAVFEGRAGLMRSRGGDRRRWYRFGQWRRGECHRRPGWRDRSRRRDRRSWRSRRSHEWKRWRGQLDGWGRDGR